MKKLFFLLLLTICSSCKEMISDKIAEAIEDNCKPPSNVDSCIIDFNNFVDFKWDKMYVFPSWTMPEDITSAIGIEYKGEYVKDDTRRLIFIKKDKIVYEDNYSISSGEMKFDFFDIYFSTFCEFQTSKFMVRRVRPMDINEISNIYYLYPIY